MTGWKTPPFSIGNIYTSPETNSKSTWKLTGPQKEHSFSKHPFWGAKMLVSGRVYLQSGWIFHCHVSLPEWFPPRNYPPLKLTFSHLKMDAWKMMVSFWDGLLLGASCWFQGTNISHLWKRKIIHSILFFFFFFRRYEMLYISGNKSSKMEDINNRTV